MTVYLRDIINDVQKSDTWKTQSTITINSISSKHENNEKGVMYSKDNIEIMISDVTDEIIEKLFNSLKNRYQKNLQSMRGSEFVFD